MKTPVNKHSSSNARPRPSLAQTTRLVARALAMSPAELMASLRPATLDDLPGMLALRARVLGDQLGWDDQAYLSWRYRLGRAGQGGGDCWLLARHGDILGMVGTQDLALRCGPLACQALSLMDIMIQPELEGVGLGAWLNLALQEQAEATLAIGSNPHSIGMVNRLFDVLPNRRTHVHPVRLGHFIKTRLPAPLRSGAIVSAAENLIRAANALLLAPWAIGLNVRPLTEPGELEALDTLQQRQAATSLVHDERTPGQWRWRLIDNPRTPCQLWGAWSKDGLEACMATCLTPLDGQRQALVVADTLVPLPSGKRALRALLWKVLQHAYQAEADYVVITTYRQDLEQELRRLGFRCQPHPFETMAWSCRHQAFRALVAQHPDWTLSEFHTDRI